MTWVSIGRTTPDFHTLKLDLVTRAGFRCECNISSKGRVFGRCHIRVTHDTAQLDHCLIRKNKKFREYINSLEWNWQVSCPECNVGRMTDREGNRMQHFIYVLGLYGADRIREDLDRAPEKMKLHNSDYHDAVRWLGEE